MVNFWLEMQCFRAGCMIIIPILCLKGLILSFNYFQLFELSLVGFPYVRLMHVKMHVNDDWRCIDDYTSFLCLILIFLSFLFRQWRKDLGRRSSAENLQILLLISTIHFQKPHASSLYSGISICLQGGMLSLAMTFHDQISCKDVNLILIHAGNPLMYWKSSTQLHLMY